MHRIFYFVSQQTQTAPSNSHIISQIPGMDYLTVALVILLSWTLFNVVFRSQIPGDKRKKLPPGPLQFPIIGNLHILGTHPHKSLAELAGRYGPIMTLKLGRITTVVISSPFMAKEVLQRQDLTFSSRFVPNSVHAHSHHVFSVAWLPVGPRWRSLRKILRTSMFSGNRLDLSQQQRSRKVQDLIAFCRKSSLSGDAVDVGQAAFRTSLNSLSNTIFSKDLTDPFSDSAKEFRHLMWNIMVEAGRPNLADYFPALRMIDPQGIRRRMTFYFDKFFELLGSLIEQRLEVMSTKGDMENTEKDVLDVLLKTAQESPHEIDRIHIENMCLDVFAAGTDTTSSTVEWAMTELLRNPEVMKNAKEELRDVIGEGKQVEEDQVDRLPYLRCIVKETLRIHPPAPLLVPRKVPIDVQVLNFTIPKGSQVIINAWAIGRDSKTWENPLAFMPDRFLNTEIDVRGSDFELIPFGAGRRICPGLSMAMRIIPVMVGSLINSFDWKVEGELDVKEKFGLTLQKAVPLRVVPVPF